ncbi:hypothetical protein CISIN_1g0007011mg, partial [Citrus sinensis]
VQHLE